MKKIIALITLSLILSLSLVTAFALPSPVTSAKLGDVTITVGDKEIVIPEETIGSYLDIIHVHEAEDGSELKELGEILSTDDKLKDVFGEDFDDHSLIQLFTFEKSGDFSDGKLEINGETVDVSSAKFTVKIYMPSLKEGDEISVLVNEGQWSFAEHVRVFNGYFTIELSDLSDLDSIYAVLTEKAPLSPPTGVASNTVLLTALFFAFTAALVWSVKKYRFEK